MRVVETRDEHGRAHWYLAAIDVPEMFDRGLVREAILGELTNGPERIDPEHFRPNPVFIKFLHRVLARHAALSPGFLAEAARQQDGYVYVIDVRTPTPNGPVPPEDIIGAIEIAGSKPLRYIGSPRYLALTIRGATQLEPWLHARLVDEFRAIAR